MKRRLFIGSSSEGLKIAEQVKELLIQELDDWLEITLWNDGSVFNSQKSFMDCIINASHRFDYGVFVATGDDIARFRKIWTRIPRDNVVFEMGLFVGSLGLKRAYLLVENSCKLPTDFAGISVSKFSRQKVDKVSLRSILNELEETKNTFALRVIPSAALALGYYENFILPFCMNIKVKNFELKILIPEDINNIKQYSDEYRELYPSTPISIFEENTRPVIFQRNQDNSKYWDFPTTLVTLEKLIQKVIHCKEIGTSPEVKQWISFELRNFVGSLEVLIEENASSKKKVVVQWFPE